MQFVAQGIPGNMKQMGSARRFGLEANDNRAKATRGSFEFLPIFRPSESFFPMQYRVFLIVPCSVRVQKLTGGQVNSAVRTQLNSVDLTMDNKSAPVLSDPDCNTGVSEPS